MAAVKLSDGKVILKDGKVSCSCCGPACCLYPYPDPFGDEGGPFYPAEDLPDSISFIINGSSVTLTRDGYNFTNGFVTITAGTSWTAQIGDYTAVNGTACLISSSGWGFGLPESVQIGDGIFVGPGNFTATSDCFLSSYHISAIALEGVIGITVARISLCVWRGSVTYTGGRVDADLIYSFDGEGSYPPSTQMWSVTFNQVRDGEPDEFDICNKDNDSSDNSSPIGAYEPGANIVLVSVS